jgi:hypothetical protein
MAQDLSTLTDEQAQRVLVELFDLLPGAAKPGYDEIDMLVGDVRDASEAEVGKVLGHLDDAALRGALARQALQALSQQAALQPLLAQAVERAGRAHMVALPELVAGVIVLLAVLPTHFERDAKGAITIQWNQLQNLAALLKPVGTIVKALPKSVLARLG